MCPECGSPQRLIPVDLSFYKCGGTKPGCETEFVKLASEPEPDACPLCHRDRKLTETKVAPRKFCTNSKCPRY